MMGFVHFGEVALSQEVGELEDIVLDLFVDGRTLAGGLVPDHHLINIYP